MKKSKVKTQTVTKTHVVTAVIVGFLLLSTAALWAIGPAPIGKWYKGRGVPGYGMPGYGIPGYGIPGYGIPGGYRP